MAFVTYFFCLALVCGARANPLGQVACETIPNMYPLHGSIYDYPSLPLPMQNIGSTTVCETSPNVLGLGLGYQYPLNYGYLPYPYPRYPMPYPLGDNLGYPYSNLQVPTTTVCESSPNVVSILPIPNGPVSNVGTTTVCESTPNVLGYLPYPNVPVPNVGTTVVCETTPNVLPVNLPYPGLIPGYAPYGVPFL